MAESACERPCRRRYLRSVQVGLPRLNHVVLDMHLMRRPAEVTPLIAAHRTCGQKVLLPWRQLYEMCKSEQAVSTFKASVKLFHQEPQVLTMARPSFALAGVERRFRQRLTSVVDDHETSNVRRMVEHLRDGLPGTEEAVGTFLGEVRERAERILKIENDPDVITRLTRWWKDEAIAGPRSEAVRRALRQGDRAPFQEALGEILSRETLQQILVGVGYKHRAAEKICRWPSISALKTVALMALSLHWRVMHGVESQSDAQLVNDGSDAEFCVIALYGRGYQTEETKWVQLYEDCVSVCVKLWGA